jgi:hypothetical protein
MSKIGLQQSGQREVQAAPHDRQVLDSILHALTGLRFGSIEIVVHEGKITQIERKEKFRLV